MERLKRVWAVKAILVMVLFPCIHGANLTVGGASGWDLSSDIQDWVASTTSFTVDDDLVFSYTLDHNVVEVNQEGYDMCTTTNAISIYNSTGNTVIPLTGPGARYFICAYHCQQALKLSVLVDFPKDEYSPYDTFDFIPGEGELYCLPNCVREKSHGLWVPLITLILITFCAICFS